MAKKKYSSGRSGAAQRQFTASVAKAKKTSTKSYTSESAGGTKSQTEAGKKFVAEKLGLGLGNKANQLKGKDQKFYGSEASAATNEYLVSIGEAKKGNPYYDHKGNITGYSYILTAKGKEMKYGKSGSAMGSGDPTGIMTSTKISPEMWEQQNKIQAAILGVLSFAAPMGAGQLLRMAATKKLKDSPYSGYESKFLQYQSGEKTISPQPTNNQQANNQIDMTTISGTGTMGDTEVASSNVKNKAAILAGKSVKLRKILT
tara:strand:- start:130 stop:906 length:777 start_codon:yes stop_codon:yes gene_type:complete